MFIKKIIAALKNFFYPKIEEINEEKLLCNLIKNLLKYLENYKLSAHEQRLILAEAQRSLNKCKKESDLYKLASQILSVLEDGKLTYAECRKIKAVAYKKLIDYNFDLS